MTNIMYIYIYIYVSVVPLLDLKPHWRFSSAMVGTSLFNRILASTSPAMVIRVSQR